MKKVFVALMILIPALSFASVKSEIEKIDTDVQTCLDNPDNQSTYGMNKCLGDGYEAADKVMNRIYQATVKDLRKKTNDQSEAQSNAEMLKRLVTSQRAWVAFRTAESQLHGIEMLGGSGESQVVIGTAYRLTKERVTTLVELFGEN